MDPFQALMSQGMPGGMGQAGMMPQPGAGPTVPQPMGGGGGGKGGGLNPWMSQLDPQQQKAAKLRAMIGAMSGFSRDPSLGPMYGLGQLDQIVDETYRRTEREKTRLAQRDREAEDKRRYEERKAEDAAWRDEQRKSREEAAKRAEESARREQERLDMSREDQKWQREENERRLEREKRLAGLRAKIARGEATPEDQIEYMDLGGAYRNPALGFGLTTPGGADAGGPATDEDILRQGVNPPGPQGPQAPAAPQVAAPQVAAPQAAMPPMIGGLGGGGPATDMNAPGAGQGVTPGLNPQFVDQWRQRYLGTRPQGPQYMGLGQYR